MDFSQLALALIAKINLAELVTYGFYSLLCWLIRAHLATLKKLQRDIGKIQLTLERNVEWQKGVEHRLGQLEERI